MAKSEVDNYLERLRIIDRVVSFQNLDKDIFMDKVDIFTT